MRALGDGSQNWRTRRWEVKHMPGGGQRSPPRGGADPAAANQQLLVDSDSDASGGAAARDAPGPSAPQGSNTWFGGRAAGACGLRVMEVPG